MSDAGISSASINRRALLLVSAAVTALIVGYLLSLLQRYYVDVLYMDAWEMVPLVEKSYSGTLSFGDFWQQANEHRPVFPRLILTPLARLTHWNTHVEVALNLMLGALMLWTVVWYLRRAKLGDAVSPFWGVPFAALFIFGAGQWENWLWGWEFLIFLQVAASFIGLYILTAEGSGAFAAALVLGIVSSFSFGNGLMFWPAGLIVLWLTMTPGRRGRLVAFIFVAVVVVAMYMHGWKPNPGHPSVARNFANADTLLNMLRYTAIYLGTPVCSFSENGALCAGLSGYLLFVWVALEARRRKSLAWPLGLQVAVLTGSFLTAAGRAGFGMSQAMSSRYQTISMPFWVGVVLFFVVLLASKEPRRYTSAHLGRGLLYAMPIMLAIFSGGSSVSSEAQWRRWNTNLTPAREALRTNGDGLLQTRLYPSAFVVAERRQILLRHKLLVFRKGESETPVK